MCGIAAIINPETRDKKLIGPMLDKISHRGDSAPVQTEFGNSILGSVRLRIVDIDHGTQPFFNENETAGVVFNGEIYNYKELRSELEQKGHIFKTDCDTEILAHLYEEYGMQFIEMLEGMFAFLIFDKIKNEFYGVRDFFGVKPFFYLRKNDTVFISSEMKSFDGFDSGPVNELKPGHYLSNDGVFQYYKIPETKYVTDTIETVAMKVRELLDAAVKKRVQTDLPIAVFLSGGLDSSIVHLLCTKYNNNVTGIIIGEESSDDVIFAKRFCEELDLKYCHVNSKKDELLENVPEIIYSVETFEPNVVRGSLLSMKLAKTAHDLGFKIAICGEGSDEVFGGYGDFLFIDPEKNADEFQKKILALLNDLYRTQLLRIDRTGMNYSLEIREPFLDRELVEFALNIQPKMKVAEDKNGQLTTKLILREAFKDILPEYIYNRPKMTLLEGAGTGSVEKESGILYEFAGNRLSDKDSSEIIKNNPSYYLQNKEEAYCFDLFYRHYSNAEFAAQRVIHAKKEIPKSPDLTKN